VNLASLCEPSQKGLFTLHPGVRGIVLEALINAKVARTGTRNRQLQWSHWDKLE